MKTVSLLPLLAGEWGMLNGGWWSIEIDAIVQLGIVFSHIVKAFCFVGILILKCPESASGFA